MQIRNPARFRKEEDDGQNGSDSFNLSKDLDVPGGKDVKLNTVCPESTLSSSERRSFVKKAVIAGAAFGVGSTLFSAPSLLPKTAAKSLSGCGAFCNLNIDPTGKNDGTFCTLCRCNDEEIPSNVLRFGKNVCCHCETLIRGQGIGSNQFCNSNKNQYGLDFYTNHTKRMSITNSGSVGIGTATPQRMLCVNGKIHASCGVGLGTQTINTTLAVNGSIAAKVATPMAAYKMGASDFAVIANATSAAFTVTLPPADTATGMIVFVKKMDNSGNAVTVQGYTNTAKPPVTDNIEGMTSKSLKKQYDSLQLISNGGHTWAILGNSICHGFTY